MNLFMIGRHLCQRESDLSSIRRHEPVRVSLHSMRAADAAGGRGRAWPWLACYRVSLTSSRTRYGVAGKPMYVRHTHAIPPAFEVATWWDFSIF